MAAEWGSAAMQQAAQGSAVPTQTADLAFFLPISAAYVGVCLIWLAVRRVRPTSWPDEADVRFDRRWLDFALVLVVAAGVIGLGRAYDAGWLIPRGSGDWSYLTYDLNALIWYSPMFLVLALRRQSTATMLLTARGLPVKLGWGFVLALVGLAIYLGLRGELGRYGAVLGEAITLHALAHFVPVFLEAAAVAFAFLRLRAVLGTAPALLVPCVLFAAAHIPRSIEAGEGAGEIAAFFALNTLLPFAIFWTVLRSKDIVWIGIVHYLLDVAIGAFS